MAHLSTPQHTLLLGKSRQVFYHLLSVKKVPHFGVTTVNITQGVEGKTQNIF